MTVIVFFKSPAAGDVIMFGDVAHKMMQIIGKDVTDKGIVTSEQLPSAIAALKAAIVADKTQPHKDDETEQPSEAIARPVSLAQRAVPLLELFEWAQKKQKPVTWGV